MSAAPSEECLRKLSEDYFDLNGSYIETLDAPPSALEFSRLVHVSRPVVIKDSGDVLYLQSQNGNVYTNRTFEGEDDPSEFEALRADIPKDVPWCTEALDRSPDAVNLWIGDGRSVTSIHSDPYENIYTVIRGQKHFILLPPTDGWAMRERSYPHARYIRPTPDFPLTLQPSQGTPPVRWASIPDPSEHLPSSVHPLFVTLNAGDTLYLPAGWWHHVRQSGITIALNWWYDLEMRGMTWALLSFLRGSEEVPDGTEESGEDGQRSKDGRDEESSSEDGVEAPLE
ncbi:Clavaminate synthase-like protein [Schizophyllum commune Tattone D]|nr:Clavaminate synthase-like protein [Schizophyllum commune Tattone D]